ncbi:MAG TPA: hypothetical protein VHM70_04585 [Polyangiaceae bacterium]|jgi:hypothetical protein|nr:hypothetical protein [Polyangiaceae bacterium]
MKGERASALALLSLAFVWGANACGDNVVMGGNTPALSSSAPVVAATSSEMRPFDEHHDGHMRDPMMVEGERPPMPSGTNLEFGHGGMGSDFDPQIASNCDSMSFADCFAARRGNGNWQGEQFSGDGGQGGSHSEVDAGLSENL